MRVRTRQRLHPRCGIQAQVGVVVPVSGRVRGAWHYDCSSHAPFSFARAAPRVASPDRPHRPVALRLFERPCADGHRRRPHRRARGCRTRPRRSLRRDGHRRRRRERRTRDGLPRGWCVRRGLQPGVRARGELRLRAMRVLRRANPVRRAMRGPSVLRAELRGVQQRLRHGPRMPRRRVQLHPRAHLLPRHRLHRNHLRPHQLRRLRPTLRRHPALRRGRVHVDARRTRCAHTAHGCA